ncbi:MAG: hypothetical protein WC924_03760 [Candidatus Gracilibacteria bacterium]
MQKKSCKSCAQVFEITDDDLNFYDKISPVLNGKKYPIPTPSLCPDCRMQRRMSFRNERNLYKRKCDFSNQEIVSVYPPTSPYKIYDQSIWWSDKWDALEYGMEYDFTRPFFEQYAELLLRVPRTGLQNDRNENSSYGNDTSNLKNCYLCFNAQDSEDCCYMTTGGFNSRDCMDIFWSLACELSYECTKVDGAYHCFYCFNCSNINDCYFCEDCLGSKNCFACIGLRQKEYCVYNQQLDKATYEAFIKNFEFTHSAIQAEKEKLRALRFKIPCKNLAISNSEDCLGDYISDSKNCNNCFDVISSENGKFIWDAVVNNSYDCFNTGLDTNFAFEAVATYVANNVKFANICINNSDLIYCDSCYYNEHLFACTGLKHKKYCILNKEYSKENYEILVAKIIEQMQKTEEWGEFPPAKLSQFGYNDSMAFEYFPLKRDEAFAKGFKWNDYVKPDLSGLKTVNGRDLPNSIREVPEEVVKWVIGCEKDGKPYKIIPEELNFYKKQALALPRLCPDCRHFERKALINPRKLWDRHCMKCGKEIKTTYAPNRLEIVYCEECYLKELY